MSGYEDAPEITFGDDALTAEQCFARSRRVLEEAELALDDAPPNASDPDWPLKVAAAGAAISLGWAELGAALRRAER